MLSQYYPVPPHGYRYELNKDFHFAAAHRIPDDRAGKCANTHGHTYSVNITVASNTVDELGFIVNFSNLKKLIHDRFDHKLLNDDPAFKVTYPTTELMAKEIWGTIQKFLIDEPNQPVCLQVIVRETPTSYVVFRPELGEMIRG